ncbi:MAG: penicillin-binding transpeptidase domain-containing protein, partial [Oscillospiraceae bacterium]
KKLELNVYATAENCMYYLKDIFKIENYDDKTARKIAGVRYGMVLSDFSIDNSQYVFAPDVPIEIVLKLKEMSHLFPGVDIVEDDIRIYPNGELIPHIVGTIGAMYAEEYDKTYRDLGYKMNSKVGRFGIEQLMESSLHGVDGVKTVEQNKHGDIISEEITTAPKSGDKVALTIDAAFQAKVNDILKGHIEWLRKRPHGAGNKVKAGSVVVLDAKTGGVLAMSNYPSYDINDYFKNYTELLSNENNPLINRATDGLYRPGSTFKTAVAVAGLEEGIINPGSTVYCGHVYRYYDIFSGNAFHPTCLGTHKDTNVTKALTVSCNIFFYDVGRRLGITQMNKYAGLLGLGEETGLELPSKSGALSSPKRSEALGTMWFEGNVVQAAIGQMDTSVSPLQLAIQAMTLANKGTRYKAHLIKEIRSYDDKTVLSSTPPQIASQFNIQPQNYNAVVDGMKGAAAKIKGAYALDNLGYGVAIKTGSPEVKKGVTNSALIGFAPVEDPKIAVGVMLEQGENANFLMRQILDAYNETCGKAATDSAPIPTDLESSPSSDISGHADSLPQ